MGQAKRIWVVSALMAALMVGLLIWQSSGNRRVVSSAPLLVYCAAGLKAPMESLAREYEREYRAPIQLQYGGSGTLLSNMRVAQRGDLFIAADQSYLDAARERQMVQEVLPLARLTPVIAVRRGNPLGLRGVSDLMRAKVALANPDAAAAGKVAMELLQRRGEWAALAPHIKVFKPTVTDVANDLKLGTVDAGIVWDATVRQYPELEAVQVAGFDEGRQQVGVGLLSYSQQPTAALRFARYLAARDRGLLAMSRAGYEVVEGDAWVVAPEVVLYSGGVNRLAIEATLDDFERREGVRVTRVYNGCGILVAQMKAGQRPDAYLACDVSFVTDVAQLFTEPVVISETDMVLLLPKGNPKGLRTLKDLARPGLRVGVANPQQSTLGALTERLLERAGVREAVAANVRTQTPTADLLVNQMRTGALDAVVVYEVNSRPVRESMEVIPLALPDAKAVQPYVIGKASKHRFLMQRLLAALTSATSRARYEAAGFRWRASGAAP